MDFNKNDSIFEKNVTIKGDLVVNGTTTVINSNTRINTPIIYNPIEKDVELSKFILEQFKTYDLQIESALRANNKLFAIPKIKSKNEF